MARYGQSRFVDTSGYRMVPQIATEQFQAWGAELTYTPPQPESFWRSAPRLILPVLLSIFLFSGVERGYRTPAPVLHFAAAPQSTDTIAAFYGAKGYGAEAWSKASPNDCRSKPIQVLSVTTTNRLGTGSITEAMNTADSAFATFVIFTVGGLIHIEQADDMRTAGHMDCLQLLPITARGEYGVLFADTLSDTGNTDCVWGAPIMRADRFDDDGTYRGVLMDFIIRGARFRTDSLFCTAGTVEQATVFTLQNCEYCIFDEMSLAFSGDGMFSANTGGLTSHGGQFRYHHVTLSNVQAGPASGDGFVSTSISKDSATMFTFYRIALAYPFNRGPDISRNDSSSQADDPDFLRSKVQILNLLNYANSSQLSQHTRGAIDADWIGNVYDHSGGQTPTCGTPRTTNAIRWYNAQGSDYVHGLHSVHASDILHEECLYSDPYDVWVEVENIGAIGFVGSLPDSVKRAQPLTPQPRFPPVLVAASALKDSLFGPSGNTGGTAGVTRLIDCDGSWRTGKRDTLDRWIVNAIREQRDKPGDIVPDFVSWTDQVAAYTTGTPCTDTDGDGLPDAFESRMTNGASVTSLAPEGDCGGNGYWNIEEWIGGLEQPSTLSWNDAVDEDEYRVKRWTAASGTWTQIGTAAQNATSFTVPAADWEVGDSLRVHRWSASFGEETAPNNAVVVTCP